MFEDNNKVYTIYEGHMEFHRGKAGGWMLIGEFSDEDIEDKGFCPFFVVTLVRKYPQVEGVKVHQPCYINIIILFVAISLWHKTFVIVFLLIFPVLPIFGSFYDMWTKCCLLFVMLLNFNFSQKYQFQLSNFRNILDKSIH